VLFFNLNFNNAKLRSEISDFAEVEIIPKITPIIKQNRIPN